LETIMAKNPDAIRLGEFVAILGMNRETFRSMLAREDTPLSRFETDGRGRQRTYDGADLFAQEIFMSLVASVGRQDASEAIAFSGIVERYLDQLDAEAPEDLWLVDMVLTTGNRRSYAALRSEVTDDDFAAAASVVMLRAAPIYAAAQARAAAAGYRLDGKALVKDEVAPA
tara:strand:- start:5322 stop:5834 length:513 start_codon:yes stop_codon:yes gene_type:complete